MKAPLPRPDRLLHGPAAWGGDRLAGSDEWIHSWTSAEIVELENALVAVQALWRPLDQIGRDDFPLCGLAASLDRWRVDLLRGRGFVLLRGLDAEKYTCEEIATIFWGIGAHLGRPVPQNAKGHLLGHVKDLGRDADEPSTRIYLWLSKTLSAPSSTRCDGLSRATAGVLGS